MRKPSGSTEGGAGVVLLVPEALGGTADPERLRRTLVGPPRATRVLLCLTGGVGHELATALAQLELDLQILLAADAPQPQTKTHCLRAPPGMSPNDQTEFALALCDVVLVASKSDQQPLARTATKLGKILVVPGSPLPALASLATVTHRLDPESHGWRILRHINGRVEQIMLELLAFGWSGWTRAGCAESGKRLGRCFGRKWLPAPYFAPNRWPKLSPDRAAVDPAAPIVAGFEAMDRSALHGSYIHRDIAWVTYFGAAFAVLWAVAGYVSDRHLLFGILEVVTLSLVAIAVFWARFTGLQDRWTACRFAAEQLRIARMSLPLFVLPPALATADTPSNGHRGEDKLALAQVKRVVRDHGLPNLDDPSPRRAAAWLQLIVSDQVEYHRRNRHKLERAEARLRRVTQLFFGLAFVAVVWQLIEVLSEAHSNTEAHSDNKWPLLLTAAGPAFAGAFHGAGTRLGIVHRAALSEEMERELRSIDASLVPFLDAADTPEAWGDVRRLAYEAANAMGRENTSWHGLVRRYRDELP